MRSHGEPLSQDPQSQAEWSGCRTSIAARLGLVKTQRMSTFRTPQIVLFTRDIERAMAFYSALGFEEAFRTPRVGTPIHVDLVLDGYRFGLATDTSTREDHGLDPVATGQRAAVILWTDDVSAGYQWLIQLGATPIKQPEPWLDRLRIAWVEDPDGHLLQVVQAVD